jgi:uncharacterized membrane protein YkvA (DUF1232 family)
MTIMLTNGQKHESLLPEVPATEEVLIHSICQRFAIDAYIPEVKAEEDLINFQFDEAEVEWTNAEYWRIGRLAENGKYYEAKEQIFDAGIICATQSNTLRLYNQLPIKCKFSEFDTKSPINAEVLFMALKPTTKKAAPEKTAQRRVTAKKVTVSSAQAKKADKQKNQLSAKHKEKLKQGLEGYEKKAEKYIKDPSKLGKLAEDAINKMDDVPTGPFEEVWAYLTAMIRLIRAYWKNEYRAIPWQSMVSIIAAVAYFVSPIDIIPDVIPVVGYLDDAFVIALVLKSVKGDLDKFMRWESKQ